MRNSRYFQKERQLKRETRDATKPDFDDSLRRNPADALQGYNNYYCLECGLPFKSHFEETHCPDCESVNLEYEGYSNTLFLIKEQNQCQQ